MTNPTVLQILTERIITNSQNYSMFNGNWIIKLHNNTIWNNKKLPKANELELILHYYAFDGNSFYFYKGEEFILEIPASVVLETNWIHVKPIINEADEDDDDVIECDFLQMIANSYEDFARDKRKALALENNLVLKNEVCENIDFVAKVSWKGDTYPICKVKDIICTMKNAMVKSIEMPSKFLKEGYATFDLNLKLDDKVVPLQSCSLKTLVFLDNF